MKYTIIFLLKKLLHFSDHWKIVSFLLIISYFSPNTLDAQTPGNVSADMQAWYKADAGVTGGATVSQWDDQSGNGINVTQSNSADQPATGGMINFHPAIIFSGDSGEELAYSTRFIDSDAAGTMFGAATNERRSGTYQNLASFGGDNPHMGSGNSGTTGLEQILYSGGFVTIDQPIIPTEANVWYGCAIKWN